jgi:hypothetical protein
VRWADAYGDARTLYGQDSLCSDGQRKEFTDRLFGVRKRAESGLHEFAADCAG